MKPKYLDLNKPEDKKIFRECTKEMKDMLFESPDPYEIRVLKIDISTNATDS